MRINLRNRVLINFVFIIVALAVFNGLLGAFLINRTTVSEEQRRVGVDLRSAWSVVQSRFDEMATLLTVLGPGKRVVGAFTQPDREEHHLALEAVRRQFHLDILGLTDGQGKVILRGAPPYTTGDDLSNDPVVSKALRGETVKGFQVLRPTRLRTEGDGLAERAFVVFEPTPMAKPRAESTEGSGLAMMAAFPIRDIKDDVMGVIFAGSLLNRNHDLVDRIRSIVFEGQAPDGGPIGAVTIFQWDVRVATNVTLPNGNRALGTRVSAEVYDKVLENNSSWYSRAFVVNEWYISAYDPIRDVENKVIGILYVGVPARKYDQIRRDLWRIYAAMSLICACLVVLAGLVFARRLTTAVHRLAEGASRISKGEYNLRVKEPKAEDELKDLTKAFNAMAASLADREERLKIARDDLEKINAALHQVNQNYLEMLGFVSHELKNTLGVIFTSAKTLAAGLAGPLNEKQGVLVSGIGKNIDAAVSMTRKYLDLTRIEKGELKVQPEKIDLVSEVVGPVLEELKGALERQGVRLVNGLPRSLPLVGDPTLLRVVFKNLLDNALKYGRENGLIKIMFHRDEKEYRFEVWNEGRGLTPDQISRTFGKFVRFKADHETDSKGTGLGLFITRDIVGKHNGTIRVESEYGRYAAFIFTLPIGPE
ncbi:MAG: cache domain-containing protein [Pseudomonadota bacterium]